MSQITWTYVDDDGYSHKVGLFHGDNSGHLLVYCNTRIVVIDFGVMASKNYSFLSMKSFAISRSKKKMAPSPMDLGLIRSLIHRETGAGGK